VKTDLLQWDLKSSGTSVCRTTAFLAEAIAIMSKASEIFPCRGKDLRKPSAAFISTARVSNLARCEGSEVSPAKMRTLKRLSDGKSSCSSNGQESAARIRI
jgi:hypothetical protein